MDNYKSLGQIFFEQEERGDRLAIDALNRYIFNNIIIPYREAEKVIDMHTHTNFSDGELSPFDLIRLAIEERIGILGITDHDTLEGIKSIDRNNSLIINSGIQIIDGIELSAKVPKGRMHILGYDFNIHDDNLNNKMTELRDNSINSFLAVMVQIKKDYGISFGYEDIKSLVNANHNLGRPDIAKLCIKYGYASSVEDAFAKYLIDAHNKTSSVRKGLQYEECLDLILKSNGIPILAHPKSLELSEKEFLELLKEMIQLGLMGIEVYHSSHTEDEIKYYLDIANKFNLLVSGGSDFHGSTVKPDVCLGSGKQNNIKIKSLSLVDYISKR